MGGHSKRQPAVQLSASQKPSQSAGASIAGGPPAPRCEGKGPGVRGWCLSSNPRLPSSVPGASPHPGRASGSPANLTCLPSASFKQGEKKTGSEAKTQGRRSPSRSAPGPAPRSTEQTPGARPGSRPHSHAQATRPPARRGSRGASQRLKTPEASLSPWYLQMDARAVISFRKFRWQDEPGGTCPPPCRCSALGGGPRAEPGPGRPGWARQGRGAAVQASDGDPGPRAAGVGSRRRAFTWPLFLIKITAVIADLLKILHLKAVFSIIFP